MKRVMILDQLGPLMSEFRLYISNRIVSHIPSRRFRGAWLNRVMGFSISTTSAIHMGCKFYCKGNLIIGEHSVVNDGCRLDSRGGLTIGSNVCIASEAVILTASHDPRSPSFEGTNRPVCVKDYVWVGLRALILPGVTLGKGCVVAAGAVVTKSVAPGDTVAGVPARVIDSGRSCLQYELNYRRLFH